MFNKPGWRRGSLLGNQKGKTKIANEKILDVLVDVKPTECIKWYDLLNK